MTDSTQNSDESSVTGRLRRFARNVARFADNASEEQQQTLLGLLEQWDLLGLLEHWERRERRQAPRKRCSLLVRYVAGDKMFTDVIRNISTDGVFMETCALLTVGQIITLIFLPPDREEPINVTGRIIRRTEDGVGVQFTAPSEDLEEMIESL